MRPRPWLAAPALAVSLLLVVPCVAEPSKVDIAVARRLFDEAQKLEEEERWLDALDRLRRVVDIKETAGVRFHMALAEERLGQLVAAEADYSRAAQLADGLKGAEGKQIVDDSTEALTRLKQRVPRVTIKLPQVEGLSLEIDGKRVEARGASHLLRRDPGELSVKATAPGRTPFSKAQVVLEGQVLVITVELPEPSAAPAVSASSPPPPPSAKPVAEPSRGVPAGVWVAAGVGVASAVTSVVFFTQMSRLSRESDELCARPDVICDREGRDAKIGQYRAFAIGGAAVAAVAAGVAVTLYATSGPSSQPSAALRVGPSGAALTGRF